MKTVEIKALIELDRRIQADHERAAPPIRTSYELAQQLILGMKDHRQEHLVCIYLNTKNQVVLRKTVFVGPLNQSITHPRGILHYAVHYCTVRVILIHNHFSDDVIPSRQDVSFTKRIQKCGEMMGITVLDRLIIGRKQYFNLEGEGMMERK